MAGVCMSEKKQETIEQMLKRYGYDVKATPHGWKLIPKGKK
jgi:N-acetyl-anhydromuramyl-L-alanine amidase AmpD